MKTALVLGISGQDGSYLAELLLEKKYSVHGMVRRSSVDNRLHRIQHLLGDITLHSGCVENYQSVYNVVEKVYPDELYHLAAQSFVKDSFDDEFSTMKINVEGTHNVLAVVKRIVPDCRVYFAALSEMFGNSKDEFQNEETRFSPRSVYGISKCAGFYLTKQYREEHGLHASSGILFNHESFRRGEEFVTKKITSAAVAGKKLFLGNMEARRDWGHAVDYVRAMWLMLQQDKADDYVVSTGITHSVRELCDLAFKNAGLDYRRYVDIDENLKRPTDVEYLCGDSSKARNVLGWFPEYGFKELIVDMM